MFYRIVCASILLISTTVVLAVYIASLDKISISGQVDESQTIPTSQVQSGLSITDRGIDDEISQNIDDEISQINCYLQHKYMLTIFLMGAVVFLGLKMVWILTDMATNKSKLLAARLQFSLVEV